MKSIIANILSDQLPNAFLLGDMNPFALVTFLYKLGIDTVNSYMKNPEVKKFLASGKKFDVCIIETFNADAFLVSWATVLI